MTALAVEKNSAERREKRARSIAAMGLVNREGDHFLVSTPSLRGKQTSYEVRRDETGKIRCNCLEYEETVVSDSAFRCEHILAVKYSLLAKNSEPATKQPEAIVSNEKENATESREMSERGEQKKDEIQQVVSEEGQSETKTLNVQPLTNTGDKTMKRENLKETEPRFVTSAEEAVAEQAENPNNVVTGNFPNKLRQLRQNVDPNLVKQREGWRDRNGTTHYVDYVEWHTVADILDETTPNWSHTIRDIKQIGDIFTVTVAITIDGVTREGLGTGNAESELGIKKAEHDALKRAAVKFGIARDLYKKESDVIERDGAVPTPTNAEFPANPIAKSLSDLVTAKQLGMIRAISREMGLDADEECQGVMNCRTDELSRKAASSFIQHLQTSQKEAPSQVPLRKVS